MKRLLILIFSAIVLQGCGSTQELAAKATDRLFDKVEEADAEGLRELLRDQLHPGIKAENRAICIALADDMELSCIGQRRDTIRWHEGG